MTELAYELLTDSDRHALERERLHRLEADHYRLTLERHITATVAPEAVTEVLLRLASIEMQINALHGWMRPEIPEEVEVA